MQVLLQQDSMYGSEANSSRPVCTSGMLHLRSLCGSAYVVADNLKTKVVAGLQVKAQSMACCQYIPLL